MPITEKQREARTTALGSSDLAAICGLDPWSNAADVYAEKVYGTKPFNTAHTLAGQWLEGAILAFARTILGKLTKNQTRRVKGFPIRCNIDALVFDGGEPVEGKMSGIANPYFKANDEWGEPGSDEVPDRVKIQSHGHMLALTNDVGALTGYPKQCHVPALLGGRGFCMFVVPFDREAAEAILIVANAFWTDHVVPRVPPPDVTPSMQTLKRIIREPEGVVDLDESLVSTINLRDMFKGCARQNQEGADEHQAVLIAALGNAEAGRLPDGRLIHYKEIQRKGYTVEPSSYRRLAIKKAPKLLEAT